MSTLNAKPKMGWKNVFVASIGAVIGYLGLIMLTLFGLMKLELSTNIYTYTWWIANYVWGFCYFFNVFRMSPLNMGNTLFKNFLYGLFSPYHQIKRFVDGFKFK